MENSSLTKNNKTEKEVIFTILRQKAYLKLIKKYSSNKYSYNTICINNMIYNESCQLVAKFKDFLIFDENTEFIRKLYNKTDIDAKLYKILDLYENYSKIFPNYLVIKEKKFMYKNIRKKQKMIDAFNQIKLEEEENRRKIKEKQENDENEDNKLFTDLVKDEIKIFQKDNNFKKYKNCFDSENDNDNTDTLYGLSHSSISLNFISKKDFLSTPTKNSDNSKNSKENETISGILNVMNDSKIYIKDLPNIFKVNYCLNKEKKSKNNIIEKKIITFKKIKKKNDANKEYFTEKKNISICKTNNNIFQKKMLTPEKRKKEMKSKNLFPFNSTILNQKSLKMFKHNIMNTNGNLNSTSTNKEKKLSQKQKIYIPSIGNTIININNNFFSEISKTERFQTQKTRKLASLNTNYNTLQNTTRENENRILSNKLSSKNQIIIKHTHILQDFSYKKKFNVRGNNKIYSNKSKGDKRKLSPQLKELNMLLNKNRNSEYIKPHFVKKSIGKKEKTEININKVQKLKEKAKRNVIKNKDNDYLLKYNSKLLTLKNKYKQCANEFSSLSYFNMAKTESNINEKTKINNLKKKKSKKLKEKQKTCFNFLKSNIKKDIIDNIFISNRNSKEKNKKILNDNNLDKKNQKSNQSKEKIILNSHSIKNKILKSETRYPYKKYIPNYINKSKAKDSNEINNNFINYSTISGKNQINNIKNMLLDSKSFEKKNKYESIELTNSDYCIHKNFFSKFDSSKRNSCKYSPRNSFSNSIKSNNKTKKLIENQILFNQTIVPKKDIYAINNQIELKNKYKSILLTRNNKKSYDFNSDNFKRYNNNILNRINNLKNTNKNYLSSKIKKNSYSIDLNNINFINYTNKSKEKDKNNNSENLFKKIVNFKNVDKKEQKKSKVNNSNQKGNFPTAIKVNTKNFLSKIKEKYKNAYNK